MIFKGSCTSQIQNGVKDHPKYEIILNDPLKLRDAIYQSMHEYIRKSYPYLSLTEPLAILMNTRQQEKEELVDYTERFKQEKRIAKSSIG